MIRKCERCQIKIKDNETKCPICGREIPLAQSEANAAAEGDKSPLYETENLKFSDRFKDIASQKTLLNAIILLILNLFQSTVVVLHRGLAFGIVSIIFEILFVIPLIMLYRDRNNRLNNAGTISALKILRALAVVYIACIGIVFAIAAASGIIIMLTGSASLAGYIPFEFYGISTESVYIAGAMIIAAAVLSAAIMLPFALSAMSIVKSIQRGFGGEMIAEIKGAKVYRLYMTAMFVFCIITAAASFGFMRSIAEGLYEAATVIIAGLPGFMISGMIIRLDNVVRISFWQNK